MKKAKLTILTLFSFFALAATFASDSQFRTKADDAEIIKLIADYKNWQRADRNPDPAKALEPFEVIGNFGGGG